MCRLGAAFEEEEVQNEINRKKIKKIKSCSIDLQKMANPLFWSG